MSTMAWGIELVRVGVVPPNLMRALRRQLIERLDRPVSVVASAVDPAPSFDPHRRQYSAATLLEILMRGLPGASDQRIGVTAVDLYLPVFTHVFGNAQVGGRVAVASYHRLRPEFSDDPPDPARLESRLLKGVLHELGHTLGLVHCRVPWCVMTLSRSPEQVDVKDAGFCPTCARRIGVPERASGLDGDLP